MKDEGEAPVLRCPLCGKPRDPAYRPFCSARCRDRDLIKWMQGDYRVPEVESEPDLDEEPLLPE